MRKIWFGLASALLVISLFSLQFLSTAQQAANQAVNEKLAGFDLKNDKFGLIWTKTAILQTDNSGGSWRQITPPKSGEQIVSSVFFSNEQHGAVILADTKISALELAQTANGGASWTKRNLSLPQEIVGEANLTEIPLEFTDEQNGFLILRLPSNSNFTRAAVFSTADGANVWRLEQNIMESGEFPLRSLLAPVHSEKQRAIAEINGKEFQFLSDAVNRISFQAPLAADENITNVDFASAETGWILAEAGRCLNFKSNCEQQARLLSTADGGKTWREITPESAKEEIKIPNSNQNLSAPVGSTRISMNRGFDKCTAATVAQMQTWWNNSPFYDSNIYISGRNRGCSQPQLSAAWVNQVSAMGWGLIPTIVGYQAPCSVCANCAKHSTDPATAETQGRGEADIALTDANNLGLTQGSVLYYDMERYDETSGTPGCRASVNAFLKGWTDRVKESGYVSGVYGSPTNAVNDWINIPAASRMDAIWMARWDNIQSVWFYASPSPQIPANFWSNHQRIKQFQAPHDETWGGVTFNIDGNIADGPVAGVRAKNKPADFDGDGKTDVSVYRPEGGFWFVQNSRNNTFGAVNFGTASDIIAPGDYNGDGKTDYAVFRPEQGTWYSYAYDPARPNAAVFRVRQFGVNGDVPVAADYDGDGNTDIAVFRQGAWYITPSFDFRDPNFRSELFGTSGDIPVPGDYDGDGRADIAVFRPSNGTWYVQRSTAGFFAVNFGTATDKPVQGDYDGDGKTDVAVYRPSNGAWYWLNANGEFKAFNWGTGNDKPAPGDFDGDGKWDFAVFRPENGFWYAMQSQAGFMAVNFGVASDRPAPAGYVPQN
ncbi:MAG TPA: glycoside hydrolase domain-containing protein [Pyrinomonadaceae bacterium]|jgi:photosystem II stability/assembly factor-like uncharacterized protein